MQIGEVIRKYRKNKNMTQEDMAKRLGVTTPAVNKWEKGVTQPDIMLLAPIARCLDITLETLLSFHVEPTEEEINRIVREIDEKFDKESFDAVFQYAKTLIQQYPNCNQLIWQLALILDARCMMDGVANADVYDKQILEWYQRALESGDEKVQRHCADALFGYYTRKEMYDKAEECLKYFEEGSVEKKRMQAVIYSKTNRINEAYKAYEEIIFSQYQLLNMVFHSLYMLSLQEGDTPLARKYIEKESSLAKLFEMSIYHATSCKLELAALDKNIQENLSVAKTMLASLEGIFSFVDSPLYSHMIFNKESYGTLIPAVRENLLECFRDDETFGYMAGNEEWEALIWRQGM